ncbi:Sodium/calcium exchanger NCL [Camellia lanceoleosa]|uniref:Sodium/calcium exchanger NCL n=1 Tax=Camellia lanceoleosa TaxID=1840588 RepID=A0ACC0HBH3_9ERIC|nr:Sodium/calcium exchanger NCL [Camellia lanceoleosa]
MRALGRFIKDNGELNTEIVEKLVSFILPTEDSDCRLTNFRLGLAYFLTLKWIFGRLFHTNDGDKDGFISEPELKALIGGMRLDKINFDQINLKEDDAVKKVMNDFDTSNDYKIDLCEFINGISKWLDEAKQAGAPSREAGPTTMKYLDDFHKVSRAMLNFSSF